MIYVVLGIIAAALIILIIAVAVSLSRPSDDGRGDRPGALEWMLTPEQKRAGIRGEWKAEEVIRSVMRDDDRLFRNVSVVFEGRPAELDNVIVNKYGVFIIEVKNYKGRLVGTENDYEWLKYKTTDAGNLYASAVKNPIRQVRRQAGVLAKYLRYYDVDVWVSGYAIMLRGNSPVDSEYVLTTVYDIERAIHTPARQMLNAQTVERILQLLE